LDAQANARSGYFGLTTSRQVFWTTPAVPTALMSSNASA
jgi:hypothetical protein